MYRFTSNQANKMQVCELRNFKNLVTVIGEGEPPLSLYFTRLKLKLLILSKTSTTLSALPKDTTSFCMAENQTGNLLINSTIP